MKILKKYKDYFIAPVVVLFIVLFIFLLKGIYPFGSKTIAIGDLGQSYMTFYHFLYDVLTGSKSLLFDYYLGMGSNTYGGFVVDGFFNPINWIVVFGGRDNIPFTLSFILIFKLMFISITSYVLFKKINKKNNYYNIVFSVLYAFSGYCLCYYSNLMWLDVVGLFPLFILATKYMFDTDNVNYFAIVLALILICNYNLAYMILIFIIVIIPIYIHYIIPKDKRKKAVFNLIIGTVLSVGLSAFAFIPALIQTMTSYRMSGVIVNSVANTVVLHKWAMVMFYSLPITIFIFGANGKEKDRKIYKVFYIALLLCYVIPVFVERVNLWWHSGSYQVFPFRYGFIPILILYMIDVYYINSIKEVDKKNKTDKKNLIIICFLFIPLIVLGVINSLHINVNNPVFAYDDKFAFAFINICLFIGIFIDILTAKIGIKKTRYILFSITSLILVICYSYAYIGRDSNSRDYEHGDEPIMYAKELSHKINSDLYRVKDLTNFQFENNPVVSNLPSMLSFLHIISKEQVENTRQLGYSSFNTKLLDGGGTIFTDQLYGIKYVVSYEKLPDRLYNLVTTFDDKYIYEYKDNISYGILSKDNVVDIPKEYKIFDANNYLYKKLFNKNDDLISIDKFHVDRSKSDLEFKLNVVGEKELYLYVPYDLNCEDTIMNNIYVNGVKKIIPLMKNKNSTLYPNGYVNGILDLGYFKDEEVIIKAEQFTDYICLSEYDVEFGQLDLVKYDEVLNTKHNLEVKIDKNNIIVTGKSEDNTNLILPITYNSGFSSNVKIRRIYNNYIEVPITKGNNKITITFKPKLFNESLIITIVTIIFMIICFFIRKVFDIRNIKFIMFLFWLIGLAIYIFVIFKFYIVSFVKTILDFV